MKSQAGFTLTELIVTITIGGILAAVAIPSFTEMVKDNKVTAATNALIGHLSLARSEAIKRRVPVALCRSANPTAVAPTCGGDANDWSTGWLVFANVDGDVPATYDGGVVDVLLRVGEPMIGDLQIRTNDDSDTYIEFDTDGTSNLPDTDTARFAICDDRGETEGRQLNIAFLGRPELKKGVPGAGITDCDTPS